MAVSEVETETVEPSADTVVVLVAEIVLFAVATKTVVGLEAEIFAVSIASILVVAVVALLRCRLYTCDSTMGSLRSSGSLDIERMQSCTHT